MPKISVIVPVYNTEKYLCRCVDSILEQTFTDFELVLVDDGSTDSSGKICDEYSKKDFRVFVIHTENGGTGYARNIGIEKATGEYFCFVDADDLIHPQMLELLLQAVLKNNCGISLCEAIEAEHYFDGLFPEIGSVSPVCMEASEETILDLYRVPLICWVVWGRLIKTDLIRRHPFTEGRYHEDTITLQWLFEAGQIAYVKEKLYFYRNNPAGVSKGRISVKYAVDGIWAVSEQLEYVRLHGYKMLEKRFAARFLYESAKAYYLAKESDKALAAVIRKKAFTEWIKNGLSANFKKGEKAFVMEMLFPIPMRIYWTVHRIFR